MSNKATKSSDRAIVDPNEISDEDAARMTFTAHLGELRDRLLKCCAALVALALLGYIFSDPIITAVKRPLDNEAVKWVMLTPLEYIVVRIRFGMYTAIVLGFPYITYHICGFVFPGLRPKEKRAVKVLMVVSGVLAILGIMLAFFGVFPLVIPYLMSMAPDWTDQMLQLNTTLNLIIKGVMAFAIAFQFPLIIFALVYMGILEPRQLKEQRSYSIVGIFIASAILTPPDPITMCLMAVPLVILYEISIWVSYAIVRRKAQAEEQ